MLSDTLTTHTLKFAVSFSLIFCQAFFFTQVYYQYPDILAEKFKLRQSEISKYMLPLSLINFASTLLVGPLFDEVGRRVLILITCPSHLIQTSAAPSSQSSAIKSTTSSGGKRQ